MAGSNPSIAITRTRRPLGTTVNANRVGGLRPGRPRKEQRRAAERHQPRGKGRSPRMAECALFIGDTRARDAQCGGHDRHRMAEEETDRHGDRERRDRPVRRRPPDVRGDRLPPEREVDEARERDERARGSRKPRAVPRERRTGLTRRQRNHQSRHECRCGDRQPEEHAQVHGDDDRVAGSGDEAGNARADANRRGRAQQQRGQHADTEARVQRDRPRTPRSAGGSQHESIDARVQVAERSQPLAQLVHASIAARRRVPAWLIAGAHDCVRRFAPRRTRTTRAASPRVVRTAQARGRRSGTIPRRADALRPRR